MSWKVWVFRWIYFKSTSFRYFLGSPFLFFVHYTMKYPEVWMFNLLNEWLILVNFFFVVLLSSRNLNDYTCWFPRIRLWNSIKVFNWMVWKYSLKAWWNLTIFPKINQNIEKKTFLLNVDELQIHRYVWKFDVS